MTHGRGLALALALTLTLAGCPAAKAPTTGAVAKPRPKATNAVAVATSIAGIPPDALTKATRGLAARAIAPAAKATALSGVVRIISDNGGGIISDNGGGIISNNSGAIISDSGGAIISDNGGGLVSNNGGGVVANNGAGLTSKAKYGVRQAGPQASTAEFALADAVITFQDAAGNLLTLPDGKPIVAYTDKMGAYRAELPLPAENVVLRVRLWNGGEVTAMAPRDAGGSRTLPIDTATSLGAAYVLEKFVKGDQKTYDKLPASEATQLRAVIAAARGMPAQAPKYERAELVGLAEALRGQAPAVDRKLEDIRALLIGQVAEGDGRRASEVALPAVEGMTMDARGRLLIGDGTLGRIRELRPDGTIGTYADLNRGNPVRQNFTELSDLVPGPAGALYVSAANSVYRCAADGTVTKVAGAGSKQRGALGGPAVEANFEPAALAVTPDGTVYFVDNSTGGEGPAARLVAVGADGLARDISAEVDPATPGYLDLAALPDGTLVALTHNMEVRRWTPGRPSQGLATLTGGDGFLEARMAVAPDGTIYVSLPHLGRVEAVAADGTHKIVAGAGGPVATASLGEPSRLATGADGTLYLNDRANGLIDALGPDGAWRVAAGTTGSVRADGDLTAITINRPYGVAYDATGGLIFSENGGYTVRRFAQGAITTIAGTGVGGSGDGGPALAAKLHNPGMIAVHGDTTWVLDEGNRRLRAIGPDGTIRTVVGAMADPRLAVVATGFPALLAPGERRAPDQVVLDGARGLAVDAAGRPYWAMSLTGQVWRLASDGRVESVAGAGTADGAAIGLDALISLGFGGESEPAAEAKLVTPFGLAFDAKGDLYVAELFGFRVRRISGLDGGTPTLHRVVGKTLPEMMAFEGPVGSVEGWSQRDIAIPLPLGLCFDGENRLYIGFAGTTSLNAFSSSAGGVGLVLPPDVPPFPPGVIRVEPDGKVHHVAGPFAAYFSDPTAEDAMVGPAGLAVDAEGRLAIADFAASVLRILPPGTATGVKP